jgi:hypothetical protein
MIDDGLQPEKEAAEIATDVAEPHPRGLVSITPAERLATAWRLSAKAWGIPDDDAPRLDMTVVRRRRLKEDDADD